MLHSFCAFEKLFFFLFSFQCKYNTKKHDFVWVGLEENKFSLCSHAKTKGREMMRQIAWLFDIFDIVLEASSLHGDQEKICFHFSNKNKWHGFFFLLFFFPGFGSL